MAKSIWRISGKGPQWLASRLYMLVGSPQRLQGTFMLNHTAFAELLRRCFMLFTSTHRWFEKMQDTTQQFCERCMVHIKCPAGACGRTDKHIQPAGNHCGPLPDMRQNGFRHSRFQSKPDIFKSNPENWQLFR